MDHRTDWLVLSQLPGVGAASLWQLVKHFGTPGQALRSRVKDLQEVSGIGPRQIRGFEQRHSVLSSCLEQLEKTDRMGAEMICYDDDGYPALLREISDPPAVLFVMGDKKIISSCCIAVVGSRSSTSYGRRTAISLSTKLAAQGVAIVSGLALGIDAEAHRGALQANGKTIAVLGCGLDVYYPRQNKALHDLIAQKGAVVSEYPPGTQPEGFRFPARNRIIAGMSRGVLVVEAAKKSGSLITAQLALDEGREVYSVPGQVDSYKSEGTHWLLRQGAKLVQTEKDILEDLHMSAVLQADSPAAAESQAVALDSREKRLLEFIEAYPVSRDELIRVSGMDIADFSEALLMLELEGLVEILPGNEVCRL